MPNPVSLHHQGDIAVITVDNPPVNALSHAVRSGVWDAIEQAERDGSAAILLHCAGRTFFAGADITEFGKPPAEPWLPALLDRLEGCAVPVICAIHGTALGGGLEIALASHFRIAAADAKLGFPEVSLGILPGAGGTQRAPRLVGVEAALDLILSGKPVAAAQALKLGLIDRLAQGDLQEASLTWARELLAEGKGPRRTSELPVPADTVSADFFAQRRAAVARKSRGLPAPQAIIDCIEEATRSEFAAGSAFEREKFKELMQSPESAGLRHAFFAERQASRVDGLPAATALRPITSVGIIGAGTMGGGIAMSFANAGIAVTVLELDQQVLDRGLAVCRDNYGRSVARGRFSAEQADQFMARISGTTSYRDLAHADLLIEAAFENPDIKKTIFRQLDASCKPGAILASNTSYQDIDAIAAVTSRPQDVLGMHFFSPANVMKLLEVVRGEKTADDVLATIMQLAKKIGKVPVLSRVCYGFIGNRMLKGYFREAQMMLLEGATPAQVDEALESFGMAMGPLAVADLAGLDIGYKARQAMADLLDHPSVHVADQLVEMGRLGQKSGAGYYRYDAKTRQRLDDPDVEAMIRAEAKRLGMKAKQFTAAEIVERAIYPLINEGARILQEGIAQRSGDIDTVYIHGYGFPAHRGGPMFYADTVGAGAVYQSVCAFRDALGRPQDWQPAPLLQRLAQDGGKFGD
jgi:3-hydroxyacyl-CoA dehydrogenase